MIADVNLKLQIINMISIPAKGLIFQNVANPVVMLKRIARTVLLADIRLKPQDILQLRIIRVLLETMGHFALYQLWYVSILGKG